jgi:methylase of polypeptide subunit release factors
MYTLKLSGFPEMAFETEEGVFEPTGTSVSLVRSLAGLGRRAGRLLDLGCGCGVTGIAAAAMGLAEMPVFASDVSEKAVACAERNARAHGCEMVAKAGSLFEPWRGERFDMILDDVSGVAEEIARVSPWFANVPCASGPDGTDLVRAVIEAAPDYLVASGSLVFPIISLSNGPRILDCARSRFSEVTELGHHDWPLPPEMRGHADLLKRMHDQGSIRITQKFGMIIFHTDIYEARNPRGAA